MKKNFLLQILSMFVFLLPFLAHADESGTGKCLSYEPVKVRLSGTIVEKISPGPPEFESIENGDKPETYWVLKLSKPVCVSGDPNDEVNVETEKNVKNMQLVLNSEGYASYKHLITKKVIVEGTLFHAITGHHHTKVLLEVIDIKSVKDRNKD